MYSISTLLYQEGKIKLLVLLYNHRYDNKTITNYKHSKHQGQEEYIDEFMMLSACLIFDFSLMRLLFLHMQIFTVDVESGDMLIVGTDGLFDNMFEGQIRDIARMGAEVGLDPEQVAWTVAEHAYHNSLNKKAYTPFMQAALNAGRVFSGGKADDITVIVAYIVDA